MRSECLCGDGSEISQMGNTNPSGRDANPIIWPILLENRMKMKEVEPRGVVLWVLRRSPSTDPQCCLQCLCILS